MSKKSVIVIGAGIGGITAAIYLTKHGLHVTVLKKNVQLVGAFHPDPGFLGLHICLG